MIRGTRRNQSHRVANQVWCATHALGLVACGFAALTACSSSSTPPGDAGGDAPEGVDAGGMGASDAAGTSDATGAEAATGSDAASDGAAATVDGGSAFQPSNVRMADVSQAAGSAAVENVTSACAIVTDKTSPNGDCFTSPIEIVMQGDGSVVNLVVVRSLTVAAAGAIAVTGTVPLVIVSLSDVSIAGSIDGSSSELNIGPGGGAEADTNVVGPGPGGGAAASGTAIVGGGGGLVLRHRGLGGGQTTAAAATYGTADSRPLVGGSAGGGGAAGSGAGGGAIQITAVGTISLAVGSFVAVGGEGGRRAACRRTRTPAAAEAAAPSSSRRRR